MTSPGASATPSSLGRKPPASPAGPAPPAPQGPEPALDLSEEHFRDPAEGTSSWAVTHLPALGSGSPWAVLGGSRDVKGFWGWPSPAPAGRCKRHE